LLGRQHERFEDLKLEANARTTSDTNKTKKIAALLNKVAMSLSEGLLTLLLPH